MHRISVFVCLHLFYVDFWYDSSRWEVVYITLLDRKAGLYIATSINTGILGTLDYIGFGKKMVKKMVYVF